MRRSAATLVEVLVAIFVMGIGLLALLTLFPLGALRMAQAIQDERAASAAHNAFAICNMKGVRQDNEVVKNNGTGYDVFKDVDGASGGFVAGFNRMEADGNGPSYAVLVDPIGVRTAAGLSYEDKVAALGWLRRRNVSFLAPSGTPTRDYLRWFAALDDIYFDVDGLPRLIAGGNFERDIRFSYALLLQRPKADDAGVVDVSVVVYHQRPLGLSGNLALNEYAYQDQATVDASRNTFTINYSSGNTQPPPLRPGDWVLDATLVEHTNGKAYPHARFYRIVALTENVASSTVEIEVQQPIVTLSPANPASRTLVVMEGVVEVFQKGAGKYLDQ